MTSRIRGAVFFSGGASSWLYVSENDPNYGKSYEIVGAFSDKPGAGGIAYAKKLGVPIEVLDFQAWRRKNGVAYLDLEGREAYFDEVLNLVTPWKLDFIMLSGFMLIITEPMLSRFNNRKLNVHPADLGITDDEGVPLYTGLNVVERAMNAGDPTRSTVHILDPRVEGVDLGPIVAISDALPYQPGDDPKAHQDLMKTACDGPAFQAAFENLTRSGWPHVPWPPRFF